MLNLGFDQAGNMSDTLSRLNKRAINGGNVLRDSIGYGIASILQVEDQVRTRFIDRVSVAVNFEYYTCVISEGQARDTNSNLGVGDLINFAKIQKQDMFSQNNTCWYISLTG